VWPSARRRRGRRKAEAVKKGVALGLGLAERDSVVGREWVVLRLEGHERLWIAHGVEGGAGVSGRDQLRGTAVVVVSRAERDEETRRGNKKVHKSQRFGIRGKGVSYHLPTAHHLPSPRSTTAHARLHTHPTATSHGTRHHDRALPLLARRIQPRSRRVNRRRIHVRLHPDRTRPGPTPPRRLAPARRSASAWVQGTNESVSILHRPPPSPADPTRGMQCDSPPHGSP
jgi:hypothetical protein